MKKINFLSLLKKFLVKKNIKYKNWNYIKIETIYKLTKSNKKNQYRIRLVTINSVDKYEEIIFLKFIKNSFIIAQTMLFILVIVLLGKTT